MNYPSPNLPRNSLDGSPSPYEADLLMHSSASSSAGEDSAAKQMMPTSSLSQQQHYLKSQEQQEQAIPRPKGAGQAERRATPTVDEIRRAAAAALGKKYLNPSGGGGATGGGGGAAGMQILVKQPAPPPEYSLRGSLGGSSSHRGAAAPTTPSGHPSMITVPPVSSLRGNSSHNPPVRPSRYPLSDASVARLARSRSLDKYDAVSPASHSAWNDQSIMSGTGSQQSSHDGTATTTSTPLNLSSRMNHHRLYDGAGITAPSPPVPPPRAVSSGNYPHHPSTANAPTAVTRSTSYHFSSASGSRGRPYYEYSEEPSDAPQSRSQRLLRPYEPRPPMPPPPPPHQQLHHQLLQPISSHGGGSSSHLQHSQLTLPLVSSHSFESRSSHNTDSNTSFYADRVHGPPSRPPRRRPSLVSPEPSPPPQPAPSHQHQHQQPSSHTATSFDGYYTDGSHHPSSPPMPSSFLVLDDKSVTSGGGSRSQGSGGGGGGGGGMVEIAPGVFAPLRGSHETWRAIQRDAYRPTTCVVCGCGSAHDTTTLFVIQDASYVLCPICKVVGPVDDCDDNTSSTGAGAAGGAKTGGVGLGFTHEDLVTWFSSSSSSSSGRRL